MEKKRIDVLLVEQGYFDSREKAKRAIMAGIVHNDHEIIDKPGTKVPVDMELFVKGTVMPYVSRGGLKLEKALKIFDISMQNRVMVDIGSSTGGFTDCALQNGAQCVYAVDVGTNQLVWKLRNDPRVIVKEKTNFRYATRDLFENGIPNIATIDVSFISLKHIFIPLKDILNENDVLSNRVFEDAVAYGGWAMDIHTPGGLYDFDELPSRVVSFDGAYTIPYRSYCSRNIPNMMMAGRNISATKMAMGSTRVMGTCAIGGQAAGTAAALCIKYHCGPKDMPEHMEELQQLLLKDDCYIPGFRNTDPQDLARTAQISATSAREGFAPEKVINGVSRDENGIRNMWSSDGISPEGETLTLKLASVKKVSQVRLTFDSNFNYPIKITLSKKRQLQQRIGVPPELVKDYTVTLWRGEQKMAEQKVTENDQRQNVVTFEPTECDKVTITIHTTNGEKDVHIYEVRVYS